ncbi:MAG: FAD-binding molybdopterin dehydrogenase [Azorhizobium sp. 35-67-5]|nr:MAG: FAD-binding molybdopterin dehydrogenase [Azorhizobium sp. 35-67-5]
MDLNTVTALCRPAQRADIPPFAPGDAWLAGGTALFSEPQPQFARLIDLAALNWPALTLTEAGLEIAATCTLAQLEEVMLPPDTPALPLIVQCCQALYGSFKVRAAASVGGNLCLALPAAPMAALVVALDGVAMIWPATGGSRTLDVADLISGPGETTLAPGDLLRSILLPAAALQRRTALRRIALNPLGRSAALVIGTRDTDGAFALTVTASTRRPVRLAFPALPAPDDLAARLAAEIPPPLYHDDVHGAPEWRRHMTFLFAEQIRAELAEGVRP